MVLVLIVLVALLAPWLAPQDPYDLAALDVLDARLAPGEHAGNGMVFLLGSDEQGRDILSAVMYGLRISIGVGLVSTVIALLLGATLACWQASWAGAQKLSSCAWPTCSCRSRPSCWR